MKTSPLDKFLDKIMNIQILRDGGASAGIFGYSGADNELLNGLKKSAVAFAYEYRKPSADSSQLEQLSNEIFGHVQTLQLTYAISEKEASVLIDDLQSLMAN